MNEIEYLAGQAGLTVEQMRKILNTLRYTMNCRQQSLEAGRQKEAKESELRARGIQDTLSALTVSIRWWDIQYALNEHRGCDASYDDFVLMMHTLL